MILTYLQASCEPGCEKLLSCLTLDAIRYFPGGVAAPLDPRSLADPSHKGVYRNGARWTVDGIIVDSAGREVAGEWSPFDPERNELLRGAGLYELDESDLSRAVGVYYAALGNPSKRSISPRSLPILTKVFVGAPKNHFTLRTYKEQE